MSNEVKGLKKMRSDNRSIEPSYYCENCKCKRFSKCYCKKKKVKNDE